MHSRAKSIQLKASKNEQMTEAGRLRQEVQELRRKLQLAAEARASPEAEQELAQLEQYRGQIEDYELRLQQTFEEKQRACAELVAQRELAQQDWAISFSWCGKIRSFPPA